MGDVEVDYNNGALELTLGVNRTNVGGVTGLSPTVAIRQAGTTGTYLDWSTLTFKNAGWIVKNEPMTDLGTGFYTAILNVNGLGFTPTTGLPQQLIAEYTVPNVGEAGIQMDEITVSELRPDAKLARQYNTNRLEAEGGSPGTLKLYEDDGVTVQSTQNLTDFSGGDVSNTPGAPAKRGAAPP